MHQLVSLLPGHQFDKFVEDLDGDRYVKTFSTRSQLTTLLYAQAGGKQSLRDIQNGLLAQGSRLYHLGLPAKVAKSTLADANTNRDCRIYEQLFYTLLARCRDLTPKHRFRFKNPLYSLDATVIDLCLASFPWAKFRARKGALKLHYQFDHSGELPVFLSITNGKKHEISVAKSDLAIMPDSIFCFDMAYIDYAWFRRISDEKAFFVTRVKNNMVLRFVGQHKPPIKSGVIFDDVVEMGGFYARKDYPGKLRHIGFYDAESERYLE
ncbi:MAG: IS4 family transposase, partial [Candidatus Uhrbacteria bacterium]|nr:IS4 family transposase [Candidatus Uhrbacteria bacterium]